MDLTFWLCFSNYPVIVENESSLFSLLVIDHLLKGGPSSPLRRPSSPVLGESAEMNQVNDLCFIVSQ